MKEVVHSHKLTVDGHLFECSRLCSERGPWWSHRKCPQLHSLEMVQKTAPLNRVSNALIDRPRKPTSWLLFAAMTDTSVLWYLPSNISLPRRSGTKSLSTMGPLLAVWVTLLLAAIRTDVGASRRHFKSLQLDCFMKALNVHSRRSVFPFVGTNPGDCKMV